MSTQLLEGTEVETAVVPAPAAPDPKLVRVNDACRTILPPVARQIDETRASIEETVLAVLASFRQIEQRARDGAASTRATAGEESGGSGVHDAISAARTILDQMLQRILTSSQLSLKAIQKMTRVEQEMKRITKILDDVDRIAQDARMLSVNARIEAVRLGEMGRGFAVVASEINQLARHSEKTSTSIRSVIDVVDKSAGSALDELKQVAANDMNDAILHKGEVDQTLARLDATVHTLRESVQASATATETCASDVHHACSALQFQDQVGQQLQDACAAIRKFGAPAAGEPAAADRRDATRG